MNTAIAITFELYSRECIRSTFSVCYEWSSEMVRQHNIADANNDATHSRLRSTTQFRFSINQTNSIEFIRIRFDSYHLSILRQLWLYFLFTCGIWVMCVARSRWKRMFSHSITIQFIFFNFSCFTISLFLLIRCIYEINQFQILWQPNEGNKIVNCELRTRKVSLFCFYKNHTFAPVSSNFVFRKKWYLDYSCSWAASLNVSHAARRVNWTTNSNKTLKAELAGVKTDWWWQRYSLAYCFDFFYFNSLLVSWSH